ncbi:lysophospholipid acyltransferase family protein [Atopobacter phocae]|uniref:lysophospholipid acyltransferase family protein n=1 Tax=Atopobacter phocae TaxID=136492 RepID=UPI00046F0AAB|nr:1-acyl-sn-glycerol-3-phosphate acyltransferase [Atopobacter phocae]
MIFKLTFLFIRGLIRLLNGPTEVIGRENLPTDTGYTVVAPHHSWLDPVLVALAIQPQPVIFMAKKELFRPAFFASYIKKLGAFPVDRQNPGPSAIKIPVQAIKQDKKALIIFPTGTRYASEIKSGAATIARLSQSPVVPIAYNGPLTLLDALKRKKMQVVIGEPFYIQSKEDVKDFSNRLNAIFQTIDKVAPITTDSSEL